jgi:hypothetical protein
MLKWQFCQPYAAATITSQKVFYNAAGKVKIVNKPSGIEPATFLLVAQLLSQMCHIVPYFNYYKLKLFRSLSTKSHHEEPGKAQKKSDV